MYCQRARMRNNGRPDRRCRTRCIAGLTFVYLLPYFEEGNLCTTRSILTQPLYTNIFGSISAGNAGALARVLPNLLCPSDTRPSSARPLLVRSMYAVCTGDGLDGGSPFQTDGLFYINSQIGSAM